MITIRGAAALCLAMLAPVVVTGCSRIDSGPYPTAEKAVRIHIAAAKVGNVTILRADACGKLATAMNEHSDAEVRDEFRYYYDPQPDEFKTSSDGSSARVTGFYTNVSDLSIVFDVESRDGWKVCDIRKDNGPYGPLPGPFESK